jgi:hypothetical protein
MSREIFLRSWAVALTGAVGLGLSATPAAAQASGCQDAQTFLAERENLTKQFHKAAGKDKKIDPKVACQLLGKLATNGETGVKWITANKDWCQIPDQFAQSFKQEYDRVKELRGQACQAATKMEAMQKQARQQAEQNRNNPFGGGLTGQYKIPQGAL